MKYASETRRLEIEVDLNIHVSIYTHYVTLGIWLYPSLHSYFECKWLGWFFYSKFRLGWLFFGMEYINYAKGTPHEYNIKRLSLSREIGWLYNLLNRKEE